MPVPSQPQVGDAIPELVLPAITRTTLALFAGASGDHNPMHIDLDVARGAGMPDVFAQGMLPMAYLGRLLTQWQPQARLRSFGVRFAAMTQLRDEIRCSGRITEVFEAEGETRVRLSITAANQAGETRLSGEAVAAINPGESQS